MDFEFKEHVGTSFEAVSHITSPEEFEELVLRIATIDSDIDQLRAIHAVVIEKLSQQHVADFLDTNYGFKTIEEIMLNRRDPAMLVVSAIQRLCLPAE